MRRELGAAALLLLLIAGAVWNLHAADRLTEQVSSSLDRAEQSARLGAYDDALRELEAARAQWDSHRNYTRVFFRHPDLDGIRQAFSSLEQLLRQEDPGWPAALKLLRYALETVDEMEHLSLGTVF